MVTSELMAGVSIEVSEKERAKKGFFSINILFYIISDLQYVCMYHCINKLNIRRYLSIIFTPLQI